MYNRMFFKDSQEGKEILRFIDPHEMKSNTTRKQQKHQRKQSHAVIMNVHMANKQNMRQESAQSNQHSQTIESEEQEVLHDADYFDEHDTVQDLFCIPSIEDILDMPQVMTCKVFH